MTASQPRPRPARKGPNQLRLVLGTAALLLLVAVVWFMVNRRGQASGEVTLTPQEEQIRTVVREVYGENIVRESLRRQSGDAILALELREEKLDNAEVNLSSLARKHEEGTSLVLIKAFIRRDQ
jgi:hypothetical protein